MTVWGTGNVGRAAIAAVVADPRLELVGVIVSSPDKEGRDAADLAGLDRSTGVLATRGVVTLAGSSAVVYAASGDFRPDDALTDIEACLRAGASVVTPAVYPLYDPTTAPAAVRDRMLAAARAGGSALFASGIDPGWGNDVLPVLLSGLCVGVREIRAQEIFDYSDYDAEASVRDLVGFGHPLDYEPPMVAPTVPTMVWGGQLRMMARALGLELDEIVEHVDRLPLDADVDTRLGRFDRGTQGALRFEVRGVVAGRERLVIEHVTRITPDVAPEWPRPPAGADGAHRVIIDATPRLEVTVEAIDTDGSRAGGGNATAATRLTAAIPWLVDAVPGLYDAFDVPLGPAVSWAD
ncbi:MAG TPA: hypothetical protein VJM33_13380 [Microthrixaceae bacterium]|nr:hypothetical protein [Microthrixaceae bacterium]